MASLKLKVEQRERLYYNKYTYKATCHADGAYYTYYVKNIDECLEKITTIQNEIHRYPTYIPITFNSDSVDKLDLLIKYINSFNAKNKGCTRREGNCISFYSNDLDFIKKAPCLTGLYEAELMPAGVKYFKRDVPAPYRVYFKDARVPADVKTDIQNYLNRTEKVEASKSLDMWLSRTTSWATVWTSPSYFINYHDESSLTMMHLLFSNVLGKNYKLEKK